MRAAVGPQPEQERSRPRRDRRHLRRHRLGAQSIGLTGVDAPDQRIHEAVEHLAPEPALDERAQRVGRHLASRQHRLDRRPRHPSHAQDPRTHDGPDLARHTEREPAGQPAQRATRPHVRPGVRRRHERVTEPDALRERDPLGHPREERVCRLVDREPAELGRADVPTEPIGRLEHGHLDAGVAELERARETRDAPADDDDVRHVLCTSSTRRASTPGSVSGSTP